MQGVSDKVEIPYTQTTHRYTHHLLPSAACGLTFTNDFFSGLSDGRIHRAEYTPNGRAISERKQVAVVLVGLRSSEVRDYIEVAALQGACCGEGRPVVSPAQDRDDDGPEDERSHHAPCGVLQKLSVATSHDGSNG